MASNELCLLFAEWMDINSIRTNEHEWCCQADKFKKRCSTKEAYELFIKEKGLPVVETDLPLATEVDKALLNT